MRFVRGSATPRAPFNEAVRNVHGDSLSSDAVQRLLVRHVAIAMLQCRSLRRMRVTPHVLRHIAAMELFPAGVDSSVIPLWLGHESINERHWQR